MAEGVIDDDPDHPAGDQVGQDQGGKDDTEVIPLPDGGMENGVGGVVMALGRQPGGEPDLADGAWPLAEDSAGEQGLEGLEDLGMEAVGERRYQGSERGDKLVHGADLGAVDDPVVVEQLQDTESVRDGPLPLKRLRHL